MASDFLTKFIAWYKKKDEEAKVKERKRREQWDEERRVVPDSIVEELKLLPCEGKDLDAVHAALREIMHRHTGAPLRAPNRIQLEHNKLPDGYALGGMVVLTEGLMDSPYLLPVLAHQLWKIQHEGSLYFLEKYEKGWYPARWLNGSDAYKKMGGADFKHWFPWPQFFSSFMPVPDVEYNQEGKDNAKVLRENVFTCDGFVKSLELSQEMIAYLQQYGDMMPLRPDRPTPRERIQRLLAGG